MSFAVMQSFVQRLSNETNLAIKKQESDKKKIKNLENDKKQLETELSVKKNVLKEKKKNITRIY